MIFLTFFSTFQNKIKKVFAKKKAEKLKYNYKSCFLQTRLQFFNFFFYLIENIVE